MIYNVSNDGNIWKYNTAVDVIVCSLVPCYQQSIQADYIWSFKNNTCVLLQPVSLIFV